MEEVFLWGLLLFFGALSGFAAGLFGIGGGIILVPFFWWFFSSLGVSEDIAVRLSVGTSLAVITSVALFTSGFHFLRGRLNWKELAGTFVWIALGVSCGTIASTYLPTSLLKKGFAFILLATGLKLLKGRAEVKLQLKEKVLIPLSVYLSAFLSSMLGIGGGIVINSLLFTFSRRPAEKVVALASAVSFFNAFLGGCFYAAIPTQEVLDWQVGLVYLPAVFLAALGAVPGIKLGVHILHRVNAHFLRKAFALLLLLVSIKLVI
ncbi:sulfite exporter TauE/SafE family protein [Phorcysia thermohydrogeniphila]|uniref:Probable membrane transporter protein n=1 Tax=Phorcysia thermohydrogeniphila TaxID=936138 RepID=A0A4V2PDC1_9BACT|nr:sulfite exporter TauE/SafE family protein [Phorcysia thermohydrogeniphila]TCK04546.1 hypothetical protein CLV27_0979 [Phorcysia thermohydrogeniphila]